MPDQTRIAESGFVGDLAPEPRRGRELAVGGVELDLRDDEPLVLPGEFVDLPGEAGVWDVPAAFEDDGLDAEAGKECGGILDGDGILEFGTGNSRDGSLDREEGFLARDAGTDRHAVACGEIPLLEVLERGGGIFPGKDRGRFIAGPGPCGDYGYAYVRQGSGTDHPYAAI